jgi:predicted HTH domain antitoxin
MQLSDFPLEVAERIGRMDETTPARSVVKAAEKVSQAVQQLGLREEEAMAVSSWLLVHIHAL